MVKNKGVTLIELIVVIAILGIVAGGIALTFSIVNSADIQGCTQSIDTTLEETKNECMSKTEQTCMVLYKSSDVNHTGYYIGRVPISALTTYTPTPETDTKVGGNKIQITVTLVSSGTIDVSSNAVYFTFDRGSGAFAPMYKDVPAVSTGDYPAAITITNGSKTSVINCVQATGKHFVE